MQIDPKTTPTAVGWVDTSHPVARKARVESDYVSFGSTEALEQDYQQVPRVRVEAVSRARELVAQATYPPPETLKRIANLLAMQLPAEEF
jgi:hypothetical protein